MEPHILQFHFYQILVTDVASKLYQTSVKQLFEQRKKTNY